MRGSVPPRLNGGPQIPAAARFSNIVLSWPRAEANVGLPGMCTPNTRERVLTCRVPLTLGKLTYARSVFNKNLSSPVGEGQTGGGGPYRLLLTKNPPPVEQLIPGQNLRKISAHRKSNFSEVHEGSVKLGSASPIPPLVATRI